MGSKDNRKKKRQAARTAEVIVANPPSEGASKPSEATKTVTFWTVLTTLFSSLIVQAFGSSITTLGIKPYYVIAGLIFAASLVLIFRQRPKLTKRLFFSLLILLLAVAGGAIYGSYQLQKPKSPFSKRVGFYEIYAGSIGLLVADEMLEGHKFELFADGPIGLGNDHIPIFVTLQDGRLMLSVRLWDANGNTVARIEGTDYHLYGGNWDANKDTDKIEIVDGEGVPQLQVRYVTPTVVAIRGHVRSEKGQNIYFTDAGMTVDPLTTLLPPAPKRIFKYPSSKFPEKLADGKAE